MADPTVEYVAALSVALVRRGADEFVVYRGCAVVADEIWARVTPGEHCPAAHFAAEAIFVFRSAGGAAALVPATAATAATAADAADAANDICTRGNPAISFEAHPASGSRGLAGAMVTKADVHQRLGSELKVRAHREAIVGSIAGRNFCLIEDRHIIDCAEIAHAIAHHSSMRVLITPRAGEFLEVAIRFALDRARLRTFVLSTAQFPSSRGTVAYSLEWEQVVLASAIQGESLGLVLEARAEDRALYSVVWVLSTVRLPPIGAAKIAPRPWMAAVPLIFRARVPLPCYIAAVTAAGATPFAVLGTGDHLRGIAVPAAGEGEAATTFRAGFLDRGELVCYPSAKEAMGALAAALRREPAPFRGLARRLLRSPRWGLPTEVEIALGGLECYRSLLQTGLPRMVVDVARAYRGMRDDCNLRGPSPALVPYGEQNWLRPGRPFARSSLPVALGIAGTVHFPLGAANAGDAGAAGAATEAEAVDGEAADADANAADAAADAAANADGGEAADANAADAAADATADATADAVDGEAASETGAASEVDAASEADAASEGDAASITAAAAATTSISGNADIDAPD